MANLIGLNSNEVQIGTFIGSAFLALAICFVFYILIMGAYILTRKKHPSAKYWIELCFIALGLLLGVVSKLSVLFDVKIENGEIQHNLGSYLAYSLSAIYSLVGSLQFEGLPFSFYEMPVFHACLYFGSSLMAGLILLSVITAKASYEIYSLISLWFTQIVDYFNPKNSVYIFNSLTKDSIILAKSIKEHDGKNAVIIFTGHNIPSFSRKDPLCREVMSNSFYYYSLTKGHDVKHSTLARLKLKKCNISTLLCDMKEAECKDKNKKFAQLGNKKRRNQRRLCEFYFELDEKKKPNQEQNTTDAFEELDLLLTDIFKIKYCKAPIKRASGKFMKKLSAIDKSKSESLDLQCYEYIYKFAKLNHWCVTEQYILTFSESNYEYYERKLTERVDKIFNKIANYPLGLFFGSNENTLLSFFPELKQNTNVTLGKLFELYNTDKNKDEKDKSFQEKFVNKFEKAFKDFLLATTQVNVVNESHLSSISLLEERSKNVGEGNILAHLGYSSLQIEGGRYDYKALILGFGGNGQSALNSLYYDSAIVDKTLNITGFYADVFDQNMRDLDGIFAKNHPLYKCFTVSQGEPVAIEHAEEIYNRKNKSERKKSSDVKNDSDCKIIQSDDIDYVYRDAGIELGKKDMTFPLVQFHNKTCTALDFINFFDSVTGNSLDKTKNNYNIIVIAFGSDRTNISIANAIIDDIKRECIYGTKTQSDFKQCIAVNIRDKDNLDKLNWTYFDTENEKFSSVVVFPYGAKEEIYSYDKILDYKPQYEYSTNYESMRGMVDNPCSEKTIKTVNTLKDTMELLKKDYNNTSLTEKDLDDRNSIDYDEMTKELFASRDNADLEDVQRIKYQVGYLKLNNTKKEANRVTALYSDIMLQALQQFSTKNENNYTITYDTIKAMLKLEHERWCRFYIAHGWIYYKEDNRDKNKNNDNVKDKDKEIVLKKIHECLLPLGFVNASKYKYDLINVIMLKNKMK